MARYREPLRGRGTHTAPPNRFESARFEPDPEWGFDDEEAPDPRTQYIPDASRSALAHNDSPDVGFDASINPYRGCTHGCVYCLTPETPVLYADMTWRPIGESRAGDVLLGFDEHARGPGKPRRLRWATVLDAWWSRKATLRLRTANADVVATADHRWLRADAGWAPTAKLAPGDPLLLLPRHERAAGDLGREPAWKPERVERIEPGRLRDVVDIQTTTGTFFAAGLATHNCYARPTHEYLGFSAGLDFETRVLVKHELPELLRTELSRRSWKPQVIGISGVTDAYQPIEQKLRLTRRCLEVLAEFRNPAAIITKSRLVARDADVLQELARHDSVSVALSLTSLDPELARRMEPRAAQPKARLWAVEQLARAGVPVGVNLGPIIPGLNEHEIPALIAAAADAGARWAGWLLLRLPYAVKDLFAEWLAQHYPDRRDKVLHRIADVRDGRLSETRFGVRHRGTGLYAEQIRALVEVARRKAGLAAHGPELSAAAFRRPGGEQIPLW
jgi:DNA repair photolyase